MGVVYEGFDTIIERTVAIKTIRTDELDPSEAEEHSRRFLIEAKAAGKLNHPNIVAIYDYGKEQNLAYIVMEYVQGKELKAYFDAGHRFNTGEILRITSQLLGALEMAHANGVVHRDIKPANLFLTDKGSVKLGDFGIARIDSTHKTHAGTILGTPSYMSPEQIKGESVDQRSDLYSTGVILYQFLTGEKPFSGSMVAVMHKVINEEPPPPSTLNPQSSPAMDRVVARAMAKDQSQRYPDARQFIIALRGAVRTDEEEESEETRIINLKDLGLILEPDNASRSGATLRDGVRRDSTIAGNEELRRGEASLAAKPDTTSTLSQPSRIIEMRRKAEEAKRRAGEEYLRAEEALKLAEEAQRKEQEEAAQKAETVVSEALEMQRIATALSRETDAAILTGELVDAIKSIKPRADSALQMAGNIQSRLRDLLIAQELLQAGSQEKTESALSMSVAIQQTLREALQRLDSALRQRVEASVRLAETAIEAVATATLALRQAEPLSLQAIQAGTILESADKISQFIVKTSRLASEANNHIQDAYTGRNWLPANVLAKFQSAASANEQILKRLEQIALNFAEARRIAQEEALRRAEEEARLQAEATRRAEEDARRRAEEETRRVAREEAAHRAEEEARLQAEATLIAPAAMVEAHGTMQAIQPAKIESVTNRETLARPAPKPKNAMLVPAIVGGAIVATAVGWLALKPDGQAPAPTPGPALTSTEPSSHGAAAMIAQRQAAQTKAASQDAEWVRQQADQVAKSLSLDARLEDAKKLTREAAKENARQAAQVKSAAKAEADATAKARSKAMAKARSDAEAAAKARSEADIKARAEAASRASAEAAAKARSDADVKARAEAASRASDEAAAKAVAAAKGAAS